MSKKYQTTIVIEIEDEAILEYSGKENLDEDEKDNIAYNLAEEIALQMNDNMGYDGVNTYFANSIMYVDDFIGG